MEFIMEIIKSEGFLIAIIVSVFLLLILYITNLIKLNKIQKKYMSFMKKIGNGDNIQEKIEEYMRKVELVEEENTSIKKYCKQLNSNISECIQKIGLVRYNAFKDTGSDLSFALALLDENSSGVVLNGIYSRETSNIYAKPIEKGMSTYTLSEEEKEAINKAVQGKRGN